MKMAPLAYWLHAFFHSGSLSSAIVRDTILSYRNTWRLCRFPSCTLLPLPVINQTTTDDCADRRSRPQTHRIKPTPPSIELLACKVGGTPFFCTGFVADRGR